MAILPPSIERDKLESKGKGDTLMEIQNNPMLDIDESIKGFKLDKLFSFTVKVRWNKDCLQDGDPEITIKKIG